MTTDQRLRALQQQLADALRRRHDLAGRTAPDGSARSPIAHRAPSEPASALTAAIDEVVRLTLVLTSANARLAYADGARTRSELERALWHAQRLAEADPSACEQAEALYQLNEMRAVAVQMLAVAPMPSSAAIAAAETGDLSAWCREEQAWIAWRWASSYSLRSPRRRTRRHCDTRPGTPTALRSASGKEGDTGTPISGSALTAIAASPSDRRQRTRGES
jgi:hypothetical protein